MQTPRIAVILRYGLDRERWRQRHLDGEVVDASPYAYDLADDRFELSWSTDHAEGRLGRTIRLAVRRVLGFDVVHVWRNRHLIAQADAVWTHTEREHLAVGLLKAIRPRRYAAVSVAQSVWLWDEWPQLPGWRRRLATSLLRRHDVEVVLSRVNREVAAAEVPGRQVLRVPFGTHFATPRAAGAERPAPPPVLVVGNDRHRDWALMRRVCERLPEVGFELISRSEEVTAMPWPTNVVIRRMSQLDLLTTAYAQAAVVAIPLIANRHASGCTVAIEGLSAGLPVVASDAGGIDEYLAGSRHELVAIGDDAAFAAAVRRFVEAPDAPSAHTAATRGLTERDYVDRIGEITSALLGSRPIPSVVEDFGRAPDETSSPKAAV